MSNEIDVTELSHIGAHAHTLCHQNKTFSIHYVKKKKCSYTILFNKRKQTSKVLNIVQTEEATDDPRLHKIHSKTG